VTIASPWKPSDDRSYAAKEAILSTWPGHPAAGEEFVCYNAAKRPGQAYLEEAEHCNMQSMTFPTNRAEGDLLRGFSRGPSTNL
jgi:hypothetical protein